MRLTQKPTNKALVIATYPDAVPECYPRQYQGQQPQWFIRTSRSGVQISAVTLTPRDAWASAAHRLTAKEVNQPILF